VIRDETGLARGAAKCSTIVGDPAAAGESHNIVRGEVKYRMATKPTGAVLIKWVGNNSPRFDERIFWQDIQSIVSVNDQDVPVLSPADLKPGDTVLVQHIGKHNKPGRRRWKAVVMDEDEVAEAQAAARLSPSSFSQDSETDAPCQRSSQKRKATSTEPGCKQPGGTKKPRNKGVLWCCWYCSCIIYCRL